MLARRHACAWSLEREPATGCRLCRRGPASDALSPRHPGGQEARPSRLRGLITRARSRPRAVRRLLPSIRSASTVVGPSIPTVRREPGFHPTFRGAVGLRWLLVHPRVSRAVEDRRVESSWVRGSLWQRALARYLSTLALRWLAAEALPQPVPNSDTSCRAGRALVGWRSPNRKNAVRPRTLDVYFVGSSPARGLAPTAEVGPPHSLPRERKRDPPHPRCLRSRRTPLLK